MTYPTSYCALVYRANLLKGETLLVHAAAGGVGVAAVQVPRWDQTRWNACNVLDSLPPLPAAPDRKGLGRARNWHCGQRGEGRGGEEGRMR
jgi:hypothetical protein